jgi:hypothetical protein
MDTDDVLLCVLHCCIRRSFSLDCGSCFVATGSSAQSAVFLRTPPSGGIRKERELHIGATSSARQDFVALDPSKSRVHERRVRYCRVRCARRCFALEVTTEFDAVHSVH